MRHSTTMEVENAVRFLDALFADSSLQRVAVCLWEGTLWPNDNARAATLVLKHPGALRRMFGAGTEKGLAEAYLHDDFDIIGDMEAAFEISDSLADGLGWRQSLALSSMLRALPEGPDTNASRWSLFGGGGRQHSQERDRQAVAFHYDVSNDFYRLWLDRQMVYSCAYFESPDRDLDAAQTAKLDYLCRKLRLQAGQEVLDIGCGWGGFALHAARHHGARVVGITLSKPQAELAAARVEEAGLGDRVNIRCLDYRALGAGAKFDAIVSVGMSEHVGSDNLSAYFQIAHARLKPGGVFLNHAIGEGCRYRPSHGPSFIDEYVFPDSDIPPVRSVIAASEGAGFEVRDLENLREHYALTLRHWVRRLEAAHEAALAFVNEPTYRVWRLYTAGSAHGFDQGRLAVYQVLLAKPDPAGHARLPLTRKDWYA